MNASFSLIPPLEKKIRNKRERKQMISERGLEKLAEFAEEMKIND